MNTIPVPVPYALNALNLPADMAKNPVFQEHEPLVMAELEICLEPEAYASLTDGAEPPSEFLEVAAKGAYCFLLLASTLEFLNLKTVGEGIVKVIGLDASHTDLLTGEEIEAFRARLYRRALGSLTSWLSPRGHEIYAMSFPSGTAGIRIAVI